MGVSVAFYTFLNGYPPEPRLSSTLNKTLLSAVWLTFAWLPLAASSAPNDLVLVLDNSGSMKKNDPDFLTGVAVRKFFDELSSDSRIAILVFDQGARLVMPLTQIDEASRANFARSLDQIKYNGLYTDSPAAIERAIYELRMNARPEAYRSIVFMTDGIVDTGNEAMDAEKSDWLRNDLAAEAAELGIRIFGIAFTDNADFLLIQSLSKRTSGKYFRAYSAADIDGVFRRVTEELARAKFPAAESTPALDRLAAETAPEVLAEPEPLPALELPEAAPLFSNAQQDPESPDAKMLDPPAVLPTLEDIGAAEAAALPMLTEETTGLETPDASEPVQQIAQAEKHAGTATPAESPEAERAEASNGVQTIPSAAAEKYERPGEIVLPAWLVALVTAGFAGVVLVVVMIQFLRRRHADTAAAPDQIPKAFLNDIGGISEQPSYELGESLTVVGRIKGSDADHINYVVIPEPTVGRRHALIDFKNHCFWIADQNSLNGTFINNKRIESDTRLKHGDRIRFHTHEFEFLLLDMFETNRTMMSQAAFGDSSRAVDGGNRVESPAAGDSGKVAAVFKGN